MRLTGSLRKDSSNPRCSVEYQGKFRNLGLRKIGSGIIQVFAPKFDLKNYDDKAQNEFIADVEQR